MMAGVFDFINGVPRDSALIALMNAKGRPPGAPMARRPYDTPGIGDGMNMDMGMPKSGSVKMPMADDMGPAPNRGGVFDRIGAFLKSDDGRAALLRSGAETLRTGNIGAGIAAGAGWMDDQRIARAQQERFDAEQRLKERGVDIDDRRVTQAGEYQAAQIDDMSIGRALEAQKLEEAQRKAMAGEQLKYSEMQLLNRHRQQELALGYRRDDTARRGQDFGWQQHLTPSGTAVLTQDRTDERYYNPPPPALTTDTTVKRPGAEEGEVITTKTSAALPRITTQQQYDALPLGASYMDSLGQRAVKK